MKNRNEEVLRQYVAEVLKEGLWDDVKGAISFEDPGETWSRVSRQMGVAYRKFKRIFGNETKGIIEDWIEKMENSYDTIINDEAKKEIIDQGMQAAAEIIAIVGNDKYKLKKMLTFYLSTKFSRKFYSGNIQNIISTALAGKLGSASNEKKNS